NSSEPEPNEVEDGARAVELSHSIDVVTDNTSCHYAGDTENENHLLLSTDRGSYSMETSQPTTDIRDFILQYGPFQPDTHFLRMLKLDKAYCETCWLFANRSSPQFRPEWILGVSDWQHLSQKISRHETSLSHIQAMRDRMNYEENRSIKSANNPLRGHTEKTGDPNPGNFLREVKLLAEFDPVLKDLIYDKRQKVKYLGHEIQNEIIQTVSTAVKLEICEEIRKARYFSIVLDSTTDISKREQVSFVLRYCQFDEPNFTIVTKESFVGFFDLDNRSAKGYEKLLMRILKDLQLDFAFCRGQGYDGASVSGEHNGCKRIYKS
ncbi:Zinc finger MYM-type protein 1, partial [Orchesella cincta]